MIFKPTRLLPIFYILSTNTVLSFTFIIFHLSQAFALSKNYIRSDELYYGKTEQQGSSINNKIIIPFYPFQHALTREADSLFLSYENEAALEKYKSAHAYFRKTGNWEGVGYTGNMIAEIFTYRLYKYDLAESYLKQTERYIKENLGDDHPLLADTYMAYGTLFNQMGGHALQEEDYLNKSLKLKSNHYGLKSIQIAELNYRIGQLYQHSLSQFDLAKEYYKRALTVFKEFLPSNHPDLIKVYFALGSIYRYMDDFQRANINLDNAIYFYSLDSISNITRIARSQIVKANVLNEIKEYNISLINYASAIKIIENKNGSNDTDLIRAYLGLGVAHLRLGNINEAILDFNRSIKILNINFSNIDQYSIVIYPYLLLNKGMCFSKLQDRDSARFCLFRALELRERYFKDDRKDLALAYEYIADMYDNFSQYDSAMYYAQTALVKLIPEFNSMDYQQNPEIVNDENMTRLIDIFALKAKILMNKSKFDTQNTQSLLEAPKKTRPISAVWIASVLV